MGVSAAGFRTDAVIELDAYCCETIRENQQLSNSYVRSWPLRQADVHIVDFREFAGRIDLISGGPPCQPFSLGGKHRSHKDGRDLFPQAVRAVREAQPRAFLFETTRVSVRKRERADPPGLQQLL
jgi:DNA (cytosine-5)-methyltransferase 1